MDLASYNSLDSLLDWMVQRLCNRSRALDLGTIFAGIVAIVVSET